MSFKRTGSGRSGIYRKVALPLGGLSASRFEQYLLTLLEFAEKVDPFTSSFTRRVVCKGLVLRQLHSVESLASVVTSESDLRFDGAAERALASKMLHRSLVALTSRRTADLELASKRYFIK